MHSKKYNFFRQRVVFIKTSRVKKNTEVNNLSQHGDVYFFYFICLFARMIFLSVHTISPLVRITRKQVKYTTLKIFFCFFSGKFFFLMITDEREPGNLDLVVVIATNAFQQCQTFTDKLRW